MRQQTGLGHTSSPSDPAILRQLTGGGLSPTRQLGTNGLAKQFTGNGGVRSNMTGERPIRSQTTGEGTFIKTHSTGNRISRPKSAGPIRSGKSVDEGRGMFLVRQMTGGTGSFNSAM
jgi:hypothetical protein